MTKKDILANGPHEYPHQGEKVNSDMLRESNPDAYHPDSQPHVSAFLGRTGIEGRGNQSPGGGYHESVEVPVEFRTVDYEDYSLYESNINDLLEDPRYSSQQIANAFIAKGLEHVIGDNLSRLQRLDANTADVLIKARIEREVVEHLGSFVGVDHRAMAHSLFYLDQPEVVIENADKFSQLTHQEIVDLALATNDWRYKKAVAINLHFLRGLDAKTAYVLTDQEGYSVMWNLKSFVGLERGELARYLFDKSGLDDIPEDLRPTIAPEISAEAIAKAINTHLNAENDDTYMHDFNDYLEFVSLLPASHQPQMIVTGRKMLGDYFTKDAAVLVQLLLEGKDLTKDARSLGITEKGDAGLDQLKSIVGEIVNRIMCIEMTPETELKLLANSFLRGILKRISRFDEAQYGSDEDLVGIMKYRRIVEEDKRLAPMSPECKEE